MQWEDVGGLNDVKQILNEIFIWPTKVLCLVLFCLILKKREPASLFYSYWS